MTWKFSAQSTYSIGMLDLRENDTSSEIDSDRNITEINQKPGDLAASRAECDVLADSASRLGPVLQGQLEAVLAVVVAAEVRVRVDVHVAVVALCRVDRLREQDDGRRSARGRRDLLEVGQASDPHRISETENRTRPLKKI